MPTLRPSATDLRHTGRERGHTLAPDRSRRAGSGLTVALGLTSALGLALAQNAPKKVELADLLFAPESYENQVVLTSGTLENVGGLQGNYMLTEGFAGSGFGRSVILIPGSRSGSFEMDAPTLIGSRIDVIGVPSLDRRTSRVYFRVYDFKAPDREGGDGSGGEGRRTRGKKDRAAISPADVVANPEAFAARTVRVAGEFRGHNLLNDLPEGSALAGDDWIVKDGEQSLWVTGRRAKGSGFDLDPKAKGDCGKWLEVLGKIETRNGMAYLRASKVELAKRPSATEDERD